MTRQMVVIGCWGLSAAAVSWLLFSDGAGLANVGPIGCIGLGLIGLGVAKEMGLGVRGEVAVERVRAGESRG